MRKGGGPPLNSRLPAGRTPLIRDAGGNRQLAPPAVSTGDKDKAKAKSANIEHPMAARCLPSPLGSAGHSTTGGRGVSAPRSDGKVGGLVLARSHAANRPAMARPKWGDGPAPGGAAS